MSTPKSGAEYRNLAAYVDPSTGQEYSRYFKIPSEANDLLQRSELIETSTRLGRTLVVLIKEIGTDCLLALHLVAKQMDEKLGARYLPRVHAIYEHCRNNDLAMPSLRPTSKATAAAGPPSRTIPITTSVWSSGGRMESLYAVRRFTHPSHPMRMSYSSFRRGI